MEYALHALRMTRKGKEGSFTIGHLAPNGYLYTFYWHESAESPGHAHGHGPGREDRISACFASAKIVPLLYLNWPHFSILNCPQFHPKLLPTTLWQWFHGPLQHHQQGTAHCWNSWCDSGAGLTRTDLESHHRIGLKFGHSTLLMFTDKFHLP